LKALRGLTGRLEVSLEYLETGRELAVAEEREPRMGNAELKLRLDHRQKRSRLRSNWSSGKPARPGDQQMCPGL